MSALLYFLGFLSGAAALALAMLIIRARRRANKGDDGIGQAFFNIINY